MSNRAPSNRSAPGGFTNAQSPYISQRFMGGIVHADSVATAQRATARPRMQPCPACGHVYKMPGLAGPDGSCLNPTACARHLKRGY